MKLLPLFPLEIVVFTFEKLNLHIFENRYRQLIQDCADKGFSFGIPYFKAGTAMRFGTEVKLIEISKSYPDGRMDIRTEGISCFEIMRFRKKMEGKLYPGGYVRDIPKDFEADSKLRTQIREKLKYLYEFMNISQYPVELHENFLVSELVHKIGLNTDQEYHLLQLHTEVERQEYVLSHLNKMIPLVVEAEKMRQKIQLNGHFRQLIPPSF